MSRVEVEAARQAFDIEYYDTPTLIFHWLTAVLVLLLFVTSFIWNYVTPHNRFWRPLLESSHVSLGIVFAVLIAGRLIWRLTGMRRIRSEEGLSGTLSRIMYASLYVLLVAQSVLGFVLRWSQGEAFTFFWLFRIPALLPQNRDLAEQLEQLHNYVGWTIVVLALGHAAAALVHHYVLKDGVMKKMVWHRAANDRGAARASDTVR